MTQTRTSKSSVTFQHPFALKGVGRELPAGTYEVVTDEELIEGLSFPAFRRVSTMIFVPALAHTNSSIEMHQIEPDELAAAKRRDAQVG